MTTAIQTIKEFHDKRKCDECDAMAVWTYMAGEGDYCEEHVYRGCSCNYSYIAGDYAEKPEGIEGVDWKFVVKEETEDSMAITKEEGIWVYLDEKQRESPCCEYMYDPNGFRKYKK